MTYSMQFMKDELISSYFSKILTTDLPGYF